MESAMLLRVYRDTAGTDADYKQSFEPKWQNYVVVKI